MEWTIRVNADRSHGMKAIILSALGILVTVGVLFSLNERVDAQPSNPSAPAPGAPPVGLVCEVKVLATVVSHKTEIIQVNGTLLSMRDEWIVLQDGTDEIWVPREKVITLRASR